MNKMNIKHATFSENEKIRFWLKVDIRKPDECWPWLGGHRDRQGHGRFWIGTKKNNYSVPAHTYAFVSKGGILPDGLIVCHSRKCITAGCCNPSHLRADTYKANTEDAIAIGTFNLGNRDSHGRKGQENKSSKITNEDVDEIRSSGKTTRELAIKFKMSVCNINKIKSRSLWKHLP